jgi:VanZ family protein
MSSPPAESRPSRSAVLVRRTLWTLTLLYAAFHFVMTHLPPGGVPRVPVDDKVLHFLSYGFLSGCLSLCLWASGVAPARAAVVVLLSAAAYGALDEALQPLVGRAQEWGDWVADVAGATVAVAGMTLIRASTSALRPPLSDLAPGDSPGVSTTHQRGTEADGTNR